MPTSMRPLLVKRLSVAAMTIRRPTSRARRNPTVEKGAAHTTRTWIANRTLINVRTLVVGTTKATAFRRNPHREQSHEVCATSLPGPQGSFLTNGSHATLDRCCSIGSSKAESKAESNHSNCCKPTVIEDEEPCAPGKCIPDGINGCQRAVLLKSTCCGSHANSTPGSCSLFDWDFTV